MESASVCSLPTQAQSLQSCPALHNPMDYSPPGSSGHGIILARILEWADIFYCRGSSRPRDQTHVSCFGRQILYHWATLGLNKTPVSPKGSTEHRRLGICPSDISHWHHSPAVTCQVCKEIVAESWENQHLTHGIARTQEHLFFSLEYEFVRTSPTQDTKRTISRFSRTKNIPRCCPRQWRSQPV